MDAAEALRQAGGVVAGGSAVGATIAWVLAVVLKDLGLRVDVAHWVEWGAGLGGTGGLTILIL